MNEEAVPEKTVESVVTTTPPETNVRELLEKNLKWSQIIYEQNRKIQTRLLWSAIASWLRTILFAVPIILAIIFLPPYLKALQDSYRFLLKQEAASDPAARETVRAMLDMLPLSGTQREQLKAILAK